MRPCKGDCLVRVPGLPDLTTGISIIFHIQITAHTSHKPNMSIEYAHNKLLLKPLRSRMVRTPSNPAECRGRIDEVVEDYGKCQWPRQKKAATVLPSCGPSLRFKKTMKLKHQQHRSAPIGTPRFVTFLKNLGACLRTANPYRVREPMYKSKLDPEKMNTSSEAFTTWTKPRICRE
jgi:hypothetical protein